MSENTLDHYLNDEENINEGFFETISQMGGAPYDIMPGDEVVYRQAQHLSTLSRGTYISSSGVIAYIRNGDRHESVLASDFAPIEEYILFVNFHIKATEHIPPRGKNDR